MADSAACQSYKPGTVKLIRLVNFMCHDHFELSLGPRVNFIIGPNGSGKSALLTALVVALGGRATMTQRAKKSSDFIKTGKKHCEITVVIHNYDKVMDKERAFKPDEYGKEITVHKVIYKDESSTKLTLKSDKNKKVSERKAELDDILEHFNILINNPICILNQEVSKTFLHSKRPEDKFDLFMKATNLEQIEEDYAGARESHKQWGENDTRKTVAYKLLDSEYNNCKEKASFLENRAKLNDMRESLNIELLMAYSRDKEVESEKLKMKLQERTQSISHDQEVKSNLMEKIKSQENAITVKRSNIQTLQDNVDEANKRLDDNRSKESSIRSKRSETKCSIDNSKRRIKRHEEDIKSLERSIAEMKRQFEEQNNLDHNAEKRKLDIEKLQREIPAEQAKEKNIRLHTDQLSHSMYSVREELNGLSMKIGGIRASISQNSALLRRLKNGQEDALRKYGDHAVRIRNEIENHAARGRFRRKPIGPLGYYLRLKNPEMAPALEIHLGRNAHAFVCDNSQDMAVLQSIFKKISSHDFRQPLIISRPFGPRHDTNRHRVRHNHIKTFLDNLEIESDIVHNVLVDRCYLESILFIPDITEAENLLINPATVPTNTRMAWTKECYVVHPNHKEMSFKSFANDPSHRVLFASNNSEQIRQVEKELDNYNMELREAENQYKSAKTALDVQRNEYEENNKEIKRLISVISKKEEQLLNLKTTVVKEPQELNALESEIENNISAIAKERLDIEKLTEELLTVESDLEDVTSKKDFWIRELKKRQSEKASSDKEIEDIKSNISEIQKSIRTLTVNIANNEKEKAEETKRYESALESAARAKREVPDSARKPTRVRETEKIKDEIRKVEAQLKVELDEMEDPEKLMTNLKKRMKEIEDLTILKETNQFNFSLMTKMLDERKEGYQNLLELTVGSVATVFSAVMRTMRMNGELKIYLNDIVHKGSVAKKARTLEISVDTNYAPSQRVASVMNDETNNRRTSRSQPVEPAPLGPRPKRPRNDASGEKENDFKMTDTRSLSGGERSFSTVAFVLALWHHCQSPFKLMDEIDVFMDMVTRRVSYSALIGFAKLEVDPGQFIFFSPLDLPKIDDHGLNGETSIWIERGRRLWEMQEQLLMLDHRDKRSELFKVSVECEQHNLVIMDEKATSNIDSSNSKTNSVGNRCAGCREPIRDKFIFSVIDLNWHQDCVQCSDCSAKLNERCYTFEGKLYCRSDYWRRFGPKCYACRDSIERNELVQIIKGNRIYHLKCFICCECNKQLKAGEQLHLVDGKRLLCKQDYQHQMNCKSPTSNNNNNNNNNNNGNNNNNNNNNDNNNSSNNNNKVNCFQSSNNSQHSISATYYTLMSSQKQQQQADKLAQDSHLSSSARRPPIKLESRQSTIGISLSADENEDLEDVDGFDYDIDGEDDDIDDAEIDEEGASLDDVRSLLGSYDGANDSNNFENEENRSVIRSGQDGVDQSIAASQHQSNQAINRLKKSSNRHQVMSGSGSGEVKRRRRRRKKLQSAVADDSGGTNIGLKRLTNRNGESILNGMPPSSSILAAHPPSLSQQPQSRSVMHHQHQLHHHHHNHQAQHIQQHQQQQSNHLKSVPSSAASTASNSSTSSSMSLNRNSSSQRQHQQPCGQRSSSGHASSGGAGGGGGGGHKPTRVRTVLNEKQLQTLRDCYAHNPRPDALMKEQLVDMTGLSSRVIRVWFQNKRCKDKKKSILHKQMQQYEKDGRHLAGLTLMRGVPMVASSPVQYDDHSTVSSTPGIQQQQQQPPPPPPPGCTMIELQPGVIMQACETDASPLMSQEQSRPTHYAPTSVHLPATSQQQQPHQPVEIHAYQPPWKNLIEYTNHETTPPERLNTASPRYQHLIGQIHGYNGTSSSTYSGGGQQEGGNE